MTVHLPSSVAQSTVKLQGPGTALLDLEGSVIGAPAGSGPRAGAKICEWVPEEKMQCEVELRATIVGNSGALGDVPVIRWWVDLSHGDAVYPTPQPPLPTIAGTRMVDYSMPARGLVFRTNARQLRFGVYNEGTVTLNPLASSRVQVSIMPVAAGEERPLYPYVFSTFTPAGAVQMPFPPEAREWRITDSFGLPVAGAPVVTFIGINGALFGPVLQSAFAAYNPIPHDARAWLPDTPCFAAYK